MDVRVCFLVTISWHLTYGQRLLVFYENAVFDNYNGDLTLTNGNNIQNQYRFSSQNKTHLIHYHDDTLDHCQDIWRNISLHLLQNDYDGIASFTKSHNLLSKQLSTSNDVLDIFYQFEPSFGRLVRYLFILF